MSNTMQEFLVWSNCTNRCKFCWQCKKGDPETFLSKKEMVDCLNLVGKQLDWKINSGDDVLLVGGEILNSYAPEVDAALHSLLSKCVELIKQNKIRYLYLNTNMIYKNQINLIYLCDIFKDIEDRLKFTTSYDIYGRFNSDEDKQTFLDNLALLRDNYPKINIVVNCIITKQLVESDFDFNKFKDEYKIKYINFIPYVPVKDDRSMDVSFIDIVKVLEKQEKLYPGYINFYIDDLDLHQNKRLYEYRRYKGFVECTADYADCHHNENFRKVLNGECYICKLKEIFR